MTTDRLIGGCPCRIHENIYGAARSFGPVDESFNDIDIAYIQMRCVDLDSLCHENGPYTPDVVLFWIGGCIPGATFPSPNV